MVIISAVAKSVFMLLLGSESSLDMINIDAIVTARTMLGLSEVLNANSQSVARMVRL